MSFLDHPSLKGLKKKRSSKVELKSPEKQAPEKYRKKWRLANEERLLTVLERVGKIQLRVKFEILEDRKYKTLSGRTLVFKGVPNQGVLWDIVDRLTEDGVEEAEKWARRKNA